ncbi:zinc finger CCCH domain-containing protein 5 isoform X1 [Benincasa hispida]|uniref:zinc finger CCCH domain-containing protein 5 isoform X1 n=1 Tax=Benincasa hispida TaxID=102211 RepID=UPI001901904F|nr:zinc finger CCCH domain-containing protein 5 isoform X1 [Benincasa hispida]XP_038905959.1 zinc finger CCCH domain-containing protein 5 isoform X1 [Benincasa hispida]XP_038905960.1 zinc finger CCCH domain-containing protein 5 isoform X1 [Benincasa hispida]
MKTRYKTCSHGTACNFIHCFRNPGGDYKWADSDKPPPRYWLKKMAFLFGYLDESENEKHTELDHWDKFGKSSKSMSTDVDRYRSRRSKSRSLDHGSRRSNNSENDYKWIRHSRGEKVYEKQQSLDEEEYEKAKYDQRRKNRSNDADSDESVDKFEERSKDRDRGRRSRQPRKQDSKWGTGIRDADRDGNKDTSNDTDEGWSSGDGDKDGHQHKRRKSNGRVSGTFKSTDGSPSKSVIKDYDTRRISSSDRNKERRLTYGGKPKKARSPSAGKSGSHYFESSSRDLNTEDGYSIDSLHNDVLSDDSWEASISDRYVERFKPLDLDKEYCSNERIDKENRWDPERSYDEFEKCRETTSAMCCESGSPVCEGERSKSDVLDTVDCHGYKVNKRNHRELESSNSYKPRRSQKKSSRHDDDQYFSDLKSENTNSDGYYLSKRPRSTSHSRTKKHKHS